MSHVLRQPCIYHLGQEGKPRVFCDACLREYEDGITDKETIAELEDALESAEDELSCTQDELEELRKTEHLYG